MKNTKQEILNVSLDLFSIYGFEATSMSKIANTIGIRKASLYSHFESKQAILNEIIDEILEYYDKRSIFVNTDWNTVDIPENVDEIVKKIQEQIQFILHDPYISKARKMLVIEQFNNPKLSKLQTKQNYIDVLNYFTEFIQLLIQKDILIEEDATIMASQFCLPITVWINLCDREPERENEVMEQICKHIEQFFKVYKKFSNINKSVCQKPTVPALTYGNFL